MIGFIVPVPSDDIGSVALLNTLVSLTMQAGDYYDIVVVSKNDISSVLNHPLIQDEVIHVRYDPMDAEDRKGELAAQHIVGLKTLGNSVNYSMVVPVGTYVNEQLSRNVPHNSDQPGWYIDTGVLLKHNGFRYHPEFYQTNVSGYILNTGILQKGLLGTIDDSTACGFKTDLTSFIFLGVYGLGEATKAYFAEMHGELAKWPDSVTVASPDQGQKNKGQTTHGFRSPSGRLERVVYELNLPFIDHQAREMFVCVDDRNCIASFKEGLNVDLEVPMNARELYAVWGPRVWETYKKTAYVRNPWDLVLNKYTESPLSGLITLNEFIQREGITRQVTQIAVPGEASHVDQVLGSEGVSDSCSYTGHYRDYYNSESQELVADMFSEDIIAFGYEF